MVDMPNLVSYFIRTPIFEWCVIRCGFKNINTGNPYVQKILDYVLKIWIAIIDLIVKLFWETCMIV